MKKQISILICLSLTMIACTTNKTTTFYLLKSMELTSQKLEKTTSQSKAITILVNSIKLPEYLDRPQMVLRESEYKLQLSEYHRWAEPLKDDFSRVFVKNLNSRMSPSSAVIYSNLNGTKVSNQLSIEVLRMDINTENHAVLKVKWVLLSEKGIASMEKQNTEYSVPIINKSYESGVEAQSKAIALFADHVAKTIQVFQLKNSQI
ncbi:MAG: membrane integrity-associated transporter subunit PqiC [Methylococcales bacterium]|nr:membrane integrity-associated transporter subunit PqiC [Methylococcales bacterium]